MMRKPSTAIAFASLYLVVYYITYYYASDFRYVVWMFLGAPFVLCWMAYAIIRYGKYNEQELQENEEWGYSDKDKDSLSTF